MAISGLGTSTAIGTSLFQQTNKQLFEVASRKISQTMHKNAENMSAERIGNGFLSRVSDTTLSLGSQATREGMQEIKAVTGGSNFGAYTRAGTSVFQRTNEEAVSVASQSISKTAMQTAANMSVDKIGQGQLSEVSQVARDLGGKATQAKMQEIKAVTGTSNFGNATNIGRSEFQQTNKEAVKEASRSISFAMQQVKAVYQGQGSLSAKGSNIDIAA